MDSVTFEQICEWEPRLRDVDQCMKAIRDNMDHSFFCANLIWYTLVKPQLVTLVGWKVPEKRGGIWNLSDNTVMGEEETPPGLRSSEAYCVAYDHLFEQLPACRNCVCM